MAEVCFCMAEVCFCMADMEQELKEEWLTRTGRQINRYASSEKLNAATFMFKMHSGLIVGQYLFYNFLKKLSFCDLRQSFNCALNNNKINYTEIFYFGKKIFS